MRFALLLLFLPIFSFGQLDSAQWMLGGSASGNITNLSEGYAYTVKLEPQVGSVLTKNHIVGIQASAGFLSTGNKYSGVLFYRGIYFLSDFVGLFGQVEGGYLYRESISVFDGSVNSFQGFRFGGKAGVSTFLSQNVSLDTFLFYDGNNSYGTSARSGRSNPILEQNFGLGVGFQIYL